MVNRYAVSDLHGQLDLFNQIKEYINEHDVVYALGDFGDRGPEPWRTLKAVLDDEQFIYFMGNHDLMLIESIEYLIDYSKQYSDWNWDEEEIPYTINGPIQLLTYNGGWETLCQWIKEPQRMEYYKKLCNLPIEMTISTGDFHFISLSHAGYNPGMIGAQNVEDHVWNREHFYKKWKNLEHNKVVHGHTPIKYLIKEIDDYELKDGYCLYNNSSKINIDRAAHISGETVLLNLDTFEGKIFRVGGGTNES